MELRGFVHYFKVGLVEVRIISNAAVNKLTISDTTVIAGCRGTSIL